MDSLAQAGQIRDFGSFVKLILDIIDLLIPLLVAATLLTFFWGIAKFIARVGGDEKAVTEGKNLMIWGIIGLFIMVSIWGILRFLVGEFGFDYALPLLPTN